MNSNPEKPVVILTGASTGLGLALAKELIQSNNFKLILTARKDSLLRFKEEGIFETSDIIIRKLDVTNRKQRENLVSEVVDTYKKIDFLINNAGLCYRTVVEHIEPYELLRQMSINFYAPLDMIRLVLPNMRRRKEGHIINISSVSGMMAMPTMGLYSSSKHALEAISESLWYEVKPWNIKVSLIEPGFIKSEAFKKVPWSRKAKSVSQKSYCPYHNHYTSMEPFIAKVMGRVIAKPEAVAKKIHKLMLMKKPPLRKRVTIDAVFFNLMKKFIPGRIYHWLLYKSLPAVKKWGSANYVEDDRVNFILNKGSQKLNGELAQLDFVDSKNKTEETKLLKF